MLSAVVCVVCILDVAVRSIAGSILCFVLVLLLIHVVSIVSVAVVVSFVVSVAAVVRVVVIVLHDNLHSGNLD